MNVNAWSELRRDPASGDLLFGCQIADYIPPSPDGTQTIQALNYIHTVWYRLSSGTHYSLLTTTHTLSLRYKSP
jgi:hypothetical protein